MNVRFLVFKILEKVEKGEFAQDLLDETPVIPPNDRALLTNLVYGTLRHQGAIDKIIQPNISLINKIILRIACFQLFFLSRIPEYAIVNESVNLAKKVSSQKSAGFVNAVIRNWCRNKPKIEDKYSHPEWIIKRWVNLFGEKETELFCKCNNEVPPLYVRINPLKSVPNAVMAQFEKTPHPYGFKLTEKGSVANLLGFKDGMFHVQDLSSMYLVDLLDARPGMHVLDLCASPGGKTCSIAECMNNTGEIIAIDVSEKKVSVIEDNCKRLGISIVKTKIGDGTNIKLGSFDRILIDAPCSNTGVFRRRVEARWRLKPDDFKRLQKTQMQLLENAKDQLKPGGKLLYSTCSVDPTEDEEVIDGFLSKNKNFKLGEIVKKLPFKDNMDGVFGAVLIPT
jgi:16S rRNA (cytosine967-C5)-methyltransferase